MNTKLTNIETGSASIRVTNQKPTIDWGASQVAVEQIERLRSFAGDDASKVYINFNVAGRTVAIDSIELFSGIDDVNLLNKLTGVLAQATGVEPTSHSANFSAEETRTILQALPQRGMPSPTAG